MKTVTGKILSSTPISVSQAAKIINNFAATDNGASQAIGAYLRRASASFSELKQLHKELRKPSRSGHKHKKSKSETTVDGVRESSLEPSVFNSTREAVQLSQEASHGYGDGERKKHKNKKNKEKGEGINFRDGGVKIGIEDGEIKRREEKNEGKTVTEQSEVKKHKEKSGRKIENLEENGVNIEKGEMRDDEERGREGEKKTNKRKIRDIEEGIEKNPSSESRKKKKIKNEVDK
ncbi:hypothetical protein V6N13_039616 [Hibiscus sabdariffa]|uniref:Uncharacterized protein n=1 Tax=Hibiscus sabdariffa TaxID=183260 RepID=A0ABR2SV11_9ROSI